MISPRQPPEFPVKPKQFPDAATCKVRPSGSFGTNEILECWGRWGAGCPHRLLFGQVRYCLHREAGAGLIPQAPAPGTAAVFSPGRNDPKAGSGAPRTDPAWLDIPLIRGAPLE